MKALLINIITNIAKYTKIFISKVINNIRFESSKNTIIKAMYNPILEKKTKERNKLVLEFDNIKLQSDQLNRKINIIKEENIVYNKKINALNSFQQFLLNNQN